MNGFRIRGGRLSLDTPRVMGVLNVTPDSFSDGGRYNDPARAAARAAEMAAAGAAVIDIGAQSTRPGAAPLSAEEEWARLAPCLTAVLQAVSTPVSVDTFHPAVAERALLLGAHVINDVSGSEHNGMPALAATHGAGLVCMRPGNAADRTAGAEETVAAMKDYVRRITAVAAAAGLPSEALCLDVGIGFGSSTAGDLALITRLGEITALCPASPLLVGASRKRVVREVCAAQTEDDLLVGSVVLHTAALLNGAHLVRAHDVAETVLAARAVAALKKRSV